MTADGTRVKRIARLATDGGVTIATSESLTSGIVATRLGEGPDAAQWFRGGVIAYQEGVKFDLLGVAEGPVVTAECAEQMASGARKLLGADVVVSATGVGGPEPSEGKPPGTVFLAVVTPTGATVRELALDGDPEEVLHGVASASLGLLEDVLEGDQPDR
ncbi:CinA family protein [Marmoricola sp. URHB0036]|uniref:CinA family protein n=1 Tax=Marmoricola sp. URHB0036 TaxID=1298863 RepID=UPI0004036BF7|nr:CinA family protein [Marmoricola sp. URHB0036]